MKRILFFLLLLVNLQLTTDNGSLSIGFGEVAAQNMKEETLDNITINGKFQYTCLYCSRRYTDWTKHEKECEGRKVYCSKCGNRFTQKELAEHLKTCGLNPTNIPQQNPTTCTFCGKPKSQCRCSGTIGSGTIGSGSFGGGGSATTTDNNGNTIRAQLGMNEYGLKGKRGVTMLKNLPDILYAQTPNTQECAVRAFAFLMSLKGYDYQTIYNKLKQTARDHNIDVDIRGMRPSQVEKLFQEICNFEKIPRTNNTVSNIQSYINQNIGVITYIQVTESLLDSNGSPIYDQYGNIKTRFRQHFVTIIAYDDTYFYAAAGNPDGSVSLYTLMELTHGDAYIIR